MSGKQPWPLFSNFFQNCAVKRSNFKQTRPESLSTASPVLFADKNMLFDHIANNEKGQILKENTTS
jgi:hypothetical protein